MDKSVKICDPTQINEADVVRGGQIVILLSMYSVGINNHFDIKIILILFSIKDMRKPKLIC